jgi:hypothetical protein
VKRRLELKELKGVLDIPVLEECGTELRARMKGMRMPGKVYGALLSEISRGFKSARKGKRKRMIEEDKDHEDTTTEAEPIVEPSEGVTIEPSGNKVSARPTSLRGNQTNTAKATKADDAAIPVFLWNEAVCRGIERLCVDDP